MEERDAARLAHVGDVGAVTCFVQREPVGVIEAGARSGMRARAPLGFWVVQL
jgi:hypothetical protein